MRKPQRLSDEAVAAILDGSMPGGRAGRGLHDVAQALAPRITPRETYREQLKHAALREHARKFATTPAADPSGLDRAVEMTPTSHQPVSMVFEGVQVDMADIDKIDPRTSVDDALLLLEIAGVNVRDRNPRQ